MTSRTETIVRRILEVLTTMPDHQCRVGVLKASVDLLIRPNALESEFAEALVFAEAQRWVLGVRPALGAVKWTLTDLGHAEVLKEL